MKGAKVLVKTLEKSDIKYAFGVAGSVILGTLDELHKSDINYIPTRHEHVATSMAAGYSLATHHPSISISHVGPGAANQIIGLTAAYRDNIPVISITGNEPSYRLGKDVRHEWDILNIFSKFTKHNIQMSSDDPYSQIRDTVIRSVAGLPGPVHIDVPRDLEEIELPHPNDDDLEKLKEKSVKSPYLHSHPTEKAIEETIDLLVDAERAVVLIGNEGKWFNAAPELREFAELIDIPVATSQNSRGILPESHRLSLGVSGRIGFAPTNEYIRKSDLIIGIGTRFSDLTTSNWDIIPDEANIVHVTMQEREIDRHYLSDVNSLSDPTSFLTDIIRSLEEINQNVSFKSYAESYRKKIETTRAEYFNSNVNPTEKGVDPRKLLMSIHEQTDDYAYTTGGGVHSRFANRLPVDGLNGYFGTENFAGMSQGFPLAMGAQLAVDKPVFALEGDGGFAMVMQDLETAVRENIPVKIVIMNNQGLMSQAARQKQYYNGRYTGTIQPNCDFAQVAENFGMFSEQITSDDQISEGVEQLIKTDGPGLLDVHIDRWLGTDEYDRD